MFLVSNLVSCVHIIMCQLCSCCSNFSEAALRFQAETLRDKRCKSGGEAFGSSQALEKKYLRLTSAPAASAVRPPHVLEAALQLVKSKWLQVRSECQSVPHVSTLILHLQGLNSPYCILSEYYPPQWLGINKCKNSRCHRYVHREVSSCILRCNGVCSGYRVCGSV